MIHTTNDDLTVNEGIGNLEKLLGDGFIRLHRTFLVNAWYVRSLNANGAVLTDGTVLPVPSRRLVALRAEINAVRKPKQVPLSELVQTVYAAIP